MIRTEGTLIRKSDHGWAVQADCQASCKSCGVQKVCSGSQRQMVLDLEAISSGYAMSALQAGDSVSLDIREEELLRMTLLAYALPCFLLIVGAALGDSLGGSQGNLLAILGGMIGGVLGLAASRFLIRRHPPVVQLAKSPASASDRSSQRSQRLSPKEPPR